MREGERHGNFVSFTTSLRERPYVNTSNRFYICLVENKGDLQQQAVAVQGQFCISSRRKFVLTFLCVTPVNFICSF